MVDLVSTKKISIKSRKSKSRQVALQGLRELCLEEKKLRIVKNKLMFSIRNFCSHPRALIMSPHKELEEFAMANFITENFLHSWLNWLLKDLNGQAYFAKHGSNLNKLTKAEDIA